MAREPRNAAPSAARTLWSALAPRTRRALVASVAIGAAGRAAGLVAAVLVAGQDLRQAVASGGAAFALLAVQRALASSARAAAECDLYVAGGEAILRADVLAIPEEDPARVVLEGNPHARALVVEALPSLASDLLALALVVPWVSASLPGRLLVGLVLVVLVFLLVSVPARRAQAALLAEVVARFERLADAVVAASEARLEIAARGEEARAAVDLARTASAYEGASRRSAVAHALLGRAPVAAALVVLGLLAAWDAPSRETARRVLVEDGLLLASLGTMAFSIALASHEVVRARGRAAPLVALLALPPRPELRPAPGAPAVATDATFRLDGVSFAYVDGAANVLERLDLAWRAGQPLVLAGPNGAGKSTVLRLLLALRPPTTGRVLAGEIDLARADVPSLRRRAVLLPQRPYLGEAHTTVRESFLLACGPVGDGDAVRALARVGLAGGAAFLARRVGELSVGQRQRLALARLLTVEADLVLLDEPDANLDQSGVELVRQLVLELSSAGRRVAIAAHGRELLGLEAHVVTLGAVTAGEAPPRSPGSPG